MHDPMTVAHEIRRPWADKKPMMGGFRYYPSLVTIWHVDPEKDGTDDSCDWFYRNLTEQERAAALEMRTNVNTVNHPRCLFGTISQEDQEHILLLQWRAARDYYRPRPWWQHPRWHIHHWKIQVHFVQALKRFLFSRCAKCGKGFPWNYAPISSSWSGGGPRWFRGEPNVFHHGCDGDTYVA